MTSAIFKEPVSGPVHARTLGLDGDRQADLTVHGGPEMAVYAYPAEHREWWEAELGEALKPGAFGENLSIRGLLEPDVRAGDTFRIGSARLVVTHPRFPCVKLSAKFGRADMVKLFMAAGRPGFYLSVHTEGVLESGDRILRRAEGDGLTIQEAFALRAPTSATPAGDG